MSALSAVASALTLVSSALGATFVLVAVAAEASNFKVSPTWIELTSDTPLAAAISSTDRSVAEAIVDNVSPD